MKKFIVEKAFWDVFPEAKIGVVIAKGIDNNVKEKDRYESMLLNAEKTAKEHLTLPEFSQNPVIKVWREAFKEFKTKKGARSSIEALLKRASKGNHVGSINPLVDIYNSISLKYALPCGGEDIDTFSGDVRLTKAIGSEEFITYGSEKSEPPYEHEIIYKDDSGAICRCWNWRESVRTMLTEETTNAFLCIETIDNNREAVFQTAINELKEMMQKYLGGDLEVQILDINKREIIIL
ncbi:MAG: B3/4 domain-containing protein [Clostridiales bacterium]|nr:B3/4 domain-containing protein [Clostridiales bacterium]